MSETPQGIEAMDEDNTKVLDASFSTLWEKVKVVSELVLKLKRENKELRRNQFDQEEIHKNLLTQINQIKAELESTRSQVEKLQSNGSGIYTKEEKEALALKIQDLLAKINSRL